MYSNRKGVFIILSILMVFLFTSYSVIAVYYSRSKDVIFARYAEKLEEEYNIIVGIYSEMASLVFKNDIDVEPILSVLYDAYNSTSAEEKDRLRSRLFQYINPLYENMIKYNFRQLHFHERDNLSFLRFHKPHRYGDDLTGIRSSVEYVNDKRVPLSGFEEGRLFNGYRNVYPLEWKGENLGSVELSFSMMVIISQLEERFERQAQFIMRRSVVDKKVFGDEKDKYYETWNVDDQFALDLSVSESCILKSDIKLRDRVIVSQRLSDEMAADSESFSLHLYRGSGLVLTFKAIRNFENQIVAYLFTRTDDYELRANQRSFIIISIFFLFLFFILLAFWFHYNQSEKKIEEMLIHDQLTGAFSRRIILEKLSFELSRYKRYGNNFCICMIDVDHFKQVNDQYGHPTGDIVLLELSRIFLQKIRNTDIFGRYGGEEFLLILPETSLETAFAVIENLRLEVAGFPFPSVGQVTISCGIAQAEGNIRDPVEFIERADKKLYEAKESGRNRAVY